MKTLRVLAAALLLAGCAEVRPLAELPLFSPEPHQVADLLADYRRWSAATADEQRREFNAAQAAYDNAPSDGTRLALALALLLPRAAWRDDARAQSLLEGVEAPPSGRASARHDFAQLLLKLVAERQREQRDDRRKLEQATHQLRDERHRVEAMRQKMDALREIDREMMLQRKVP